MRPLLSALALVAVLFPASGNAQKKPITLESIQQGGRGGGGGRAGGGGQLWAPDGKSFLIRQGRAIMQYDIASKQSRQLLTTDAMEAAAVRVPTNAGEPFDWENRRVRESTLSWSDSGRELLLVLGGDIFLYRLDGGKWTQLTKTPIRERDAKLSPDSKYVSFRREWDLYTVDTASGKEVRLTKDGSDTLRNGGVDWVYPEEIGLGSAHWWSPDSKSIAYLQFDTSREPLYPHADLRGRKALFEPERYPQAGDDNPDLKLGVVPPSGGPTKWLDAGETRRTQIIARVGWMPDAKNVFVERMSRVQDRLELLTINPATGASTSILKESDPHWINFEGEPRFLKDGKQFLWMSERDGFEHVYLYSIDGRDSRQITRGPWQVDAISGFDEAKGILYYVSTEPSHLERHFYSMRLNGRDKQKLTQQEGTHSISMDPTANYYLDTHSNLKSPSQTTLHSADGKQLAVYREADRRQMEEYDILPTEIVNFKGSDGTLYYGRMIKPAGYQAGKRYPVIVYVYGGPHSLGVRNSWPSVGLDQVFAHKGYVVWQMDNRGTGGRGHEFEVPVHKRLGVQEAADQQEGVKWLIAQGIADPAKVGVYGWSYGGFMTLNLLLTAPDMFTAGVAGAPVTDWHYYDTIYTERFMGLPQENVEGYKKTSLMQYAKNLKGKLLLIHCFEDDNVLFQNSYQMNEALLSAGKRFEFILFPNKTHGAGPYSRYLQQVQVDFFDKNLK